MDTIGSAVWEDMLKEFRSLGGIAENVCLKKGRYGRGLFPKDPTKPVRVHIPDSLLVDRKYVEFHNGSFRLAPQTPIGMHERSFIENYEREFSWPIGKREIESVFETMQEGSPELRELLRNSYYAYRWVAEPTEEIVQQRFVESRVIKYKALDVIMPIVEIANHGHQTRYQTDEGVGLSGTFSDEILVRYQLCDPLQIFGKWGFASSTEFVALSIHVKDEEAGIFVDRGDPDPETESSPFMPAATVSGRQIKVPYQLLGHRRRPDLPRGIFHRIMRNANRLRGEADKIFDSILHVNRMHMLQLIEACEGTPARIGRLLRDVARFQLESMSYSMNCAEIWGI